MPLRQLPYSEARKLMKPGDVIAYSGKANVSNFIKWMTRAGVSHLSIVVQAKLLYQHADTPAEGFLNQVMEATSNGVQFSRLSDHMRYYEGELWWLPLRQELRLGGAAVQVLGGVDALNRGDWLRTLNVNLLAPFLWTQALLAALEQVQGCVVKDRKSVV